MIRKPLMPALTLTLCLAACSGGGGGANVPGDENYTKPFDGVKDGEVVRFTGTEPFWGGEAHGTVLTYTTPEDPEGHTITVTPFAGRGGMSFSGKLDGKPFDLAVSDAKCSDGMSERDYPFTVTLSIDGALRHGCAWTDRRPFVEAQAP